MCLFCCSQGLVDYEGDSDEEEEDEPEDEDLMSPKRAKLSWSASLGLSARMWENLHWLKDEWMPSLFVSVYLQLMYIFIINNGSRLSLFVYFSHSYNHFRILWFFLPGHWKHLVYLGLKRRGKTWNDILCSTQSYYTSSYCNRKF